MLSPGTVILRPIVTEKAEDDRQNRNKYVFEVARKTNKVEIRKAIERYFHVKVDKVAVMVMAGKPKRMGMFRGCRPDWKKALVTLKPGQKIEMLDRV